MGHCLQVLKRYSDFVALKRSLGALQAPTQPTDVLGALTRWDVYGLFY